ncbi:hypothetical protein [Paracoccus spongiarum]|uniref:Porin n=1 Tax=Paracoccus spongiarum TaxID=3064387 RepID=A0ABT9JJB7_9RHOB|nr:hypothetical protein [Paracoccus sp. 2205BS29-5]MDP5309152.1 hypothetical protein [Paracoccus sp. 2205BS29-5]
MAFWLVWLPLLTLLGGAAQAGPWPRAEGTHFLSLSAERDRDGNDYLGIYGEYGLSPRTTLGYEIGHSNAGESSLILWMQRPLDDGDGVFRLTWQGGIGVVRRDGDLSPVALSGLSLGRGFEGLLGGGWISAEARVKVAGVTDPVAVSAGLDDGALAYLTPETEVKADLTLGLRPRGDLMWINQLRLERRQGQDAEAKLATSLVHDLGGPVKIEAGVVLPLSGGGEQAVKLGSWLEF